MRGGDTTGLRAYNERLIIGAIRQGGASSKAEIARATGLSGQAASVIVNALLAEGVLIKQGKVRGQVGQPYTPIALNPEGAYSLGIKIGRRSVEVVLVDFLGEIVAERRTPYPAPRRETALPTAVDHARELIAELGETRLARLVGAGVAMPGDLHEWATELGLSKGDLDGWRGVDAAAEIEAALDLPATLYNDATAACAAELLAGTAVRRQSALYLYLGAFVGGGLVIGGRLYRGAQFNAGALGSVPMAERGPDGTPLQLIHLASLINLERALDAAGLDGRGAIVGEATPKEAQRRFDAWRGRAVEGLARAVAAAASVIDFEEVVIDGVLKSAWRRSMAQALIGGLSAFNRAGLSPFTVRTGTIGARAPVLGAALLPLHNRFLPDTDLLARPSPAGRA